MRTRRVLRHHVGPSVGYQEAALLPRDNGRPCCLSTGGLWCNGQLVAKGLLKEDLHKGQEMTQDASVMLADGTKVMGAIRRHG